MSAPRPMRVAVAPGSKAESYCRDYLGGSPTGPISAPQGEAIASGFGPHPGLDLSDSGGHIIVDLVFTNFFVGGADAWDSADIANIDAHLSAAMSDAGLNNVLIQYYRGEPAISSTFLPSTILPDPAPATLSQADVEDMVRSLQAAGTLLAADLRSTVFNFMLPRGVVLTIDDGSPQEAPGDDAPASPTGEVESASSSLEGLGGFHGSVHVGTDRIYYAVGVFSEGSNGIVAFDVPWKNVVATFYHELVEARTDADVEDNEVAFVNARGEEIGDIPMSLAGADLSTIMVEVPLADGSGTVPIQLMWSNAVHGPEGPIAEPHTVS